ncbi:hypothetical protein F441_21504 [Phytophthora nicotianae CJ01A1]|uniref:Uncharacterized protein n=4 Tax=Phytophthora nicotianae TaxID=4792 RepID=W2QV32_PHYN3|nr:hypothetical protein PPTG_21876 [Phytophthora nicotianae INRA-310]ETK71803.1 hypothetical protein L915_21012 [Phytophthora nicotianae]ETO60111.1 hypothetical protein F444_21650 [Phytophthora nicotianae P1976]ETP01227.1 hypothetical protein F441_21504 [Phytophthora nicotianae CJ01A1]ETL25237.1 hypothetical protein L916_20890 [Phytophthora nicotianae]ETL78454.1 hypothetical protein L917_20748 [Phytophthora nicotianae]
MNLKFVRQRLADINCIQLRSAYAHFVDRFLVRKPQLLRHVVPKAILR